MDLWLLSNAYSCPKFFYSEKQLNRNLNTILATEFVALKSLGEIMNLFEYLMTTMDASYITISE